MRAPAGDEPAGIAVPRQRAELVANRVAEQLFQRPAWRVRQLADCRDADAGEARLGDRSYAPHEADRQVMQEFEFGSGVDDHQPIRLGDL